MCPEATSQTATPSRTARAAEPDHLGVLAVRAGRRPPRRRARSTSHGSHAAAVSSAIWLGERVSVRAYSGTPVCTMPSPRFAMPVAVRCAANRRPRGSRVATCSLMGVLPATIEEKTLQRQLCKGISANEREQPPARSGPVPSGRRSSRRWRTPCGWRCTTTCPSTGRPPPASSAGTWARAAGRPATTCASWRSTASSRTTRRTSAAGTGGGARSGTASTAGTCSRTPGPPTPPRRCCRGSSPSAPRCCSGGCPLGDTPEWEGASLNDRSTADLTLEELQRGRARGAGDHRRRRQARQGAQGGRRDRGPSTRADLLRRAPAAPRR